MIKKVRRKPQVQECVEWTGDNYKEIEEFTGGKCFIENIALSNRGILHIETREGSLKADIGDHIMKGNDGGFWPVKLDYFKKNFEVIK